MCSKSAQRPAYHSRFVRVNWIVWQKILCAPGNSCEIDISEAHTNAFRSRKREKKRNCEHCKLKFFRRTTALRAYTAGNVDDSVLGKLCFQWKWIISSFVQLNRCKEVRNAELKLKWCNCTVRVHQHTCVRTYEITQNSLLFFTSSTMQSRIFCLKLKCMSCSENRDRYSCNQTNRD